MRNGTTPRRPLGDLVHDNELRESSELQDQRSVEMKAEVVCYSGYKCDERPVRFRLSGQDYFVEELLDQWYGPQECFYKVRANDGNVYNPRHRSSQTEGTWSLAS